MQPIYAVASLTCIADALHFEQAFLCMIKVKVHRAGGSAVLQVNGQVKMAWLGPHFS